MFLRNFLVMNILQFFSAVTKMQILIPSNFETSLKISEIPKNLRLESCGNRGATRTEELKQEFRRWQELWIYKKFQKSNIMFSSWSFFLVIFLWVSSVLSVFLSVSSVFLLLFFFRTFGYHWNKVAEDTYLISIWGFEYQYNYNYGIMAKSRYDAILNFRNFLKSFRVI